MDPMIVVDRSSIPGVGYGAWSTTTIATDTVFGPNNDDPDIDLDNSNILLVIKKEQPEFQLNTTSGLNHANPDVNNDTDHSCTSEINQEPQEFKPNMATYWMRHLNCARNKEEENLVAFYHKESLFYRVTKTIGPQTELLVDICKGNSCWKQHVDVPSYYKENNPSHLTKIKPIVLIKRGGSWTISNNQKKILIQFHEIIYECHQCKKKFHQKSALKSHLMIHTREQILRHKQCGKKFSHLSYQKAQLRYLNIHSREKPYECNKCCKRFSQSSILENHLRTHTGEKPYKCKKCGKSFTFASSLRSHMMTHTREKPFFCEQCEQLFNDVSNLRRHQRIHTGDRPYKCNKCNKYFTRMDNLNKHLRKHTGEKPMCKFI